MQGLAIVAAAERERTLGQLSALLGFDVEINEHGAVELTQEQLDSLPIPEVHGLPRGFRPYISSVYEIPIHLKPSTSDNEQEQP